MSIDKNVTVEYTCPLMQEGDGVAINTPCGHTSPSPIASGHFATDHREAILTRLITQMADKAAAELEKDAVEQLRRAVAFFDPPDDDDF